MVEEERGEEGEEWHCVVCVRAWWWVVVIVFLCNCNYSELCVRLGWVGARALDKERKSGKNKERIKARQESEKGVGVEKKECESKMNKR